MCKVLLACVALVALFATGDSLTCKTCKIGIKGTCFFGSTQTCSNAEPNCYCGSLAFNVSGLLSLTTKGCMATNKCNQTTTGSLLTAGYTVKTVCCSNDQCNGASSIQLPLTAALGTALVAVWMSWDH